MSDFHICRGCNPCKVHNMSCAVMHYDGKCDWKDGPCTCKPIASPTPKPEEKSEVWWFDYCKNSFGEETRDKHIFQIKALLAEQRRRVLEEVRGIVKELEISEELYRSHGAHGYIACKEAVLSSLTK